MRFATKAHLDVADRDQLDMRRHQLDLTRCHINRRLRGLDGPHALGRQRDVGKLGLGALQIALRPCDLGQQRGHPVGFVARNQLVDVSAGRLGAHLGGSHRRPRLLGHDLGRLLYLGGGGQLLRRGFGRRFEFHDGGGPPIDLFGELAPLADRRDRRGADRVRGGCDLLGLLELAGERGDSLGCGLGGDELLLGVDAFGGQPLDLRGELGMPPDRVVDLRHRSRAPGQFLVGGAQAIRRGGPLSGGTTGPGEVVEVFGLDPVDEQRVGAVTGRGLRLRHAAGLARGDVERT